MNKEKNKRPTIFTFPNTKNHALNFFFTSSPPFHAPSPTTKTHKANLKKNVDFKH
jgi:hypothetical protein